MHCSDAFGGLPSQEQCWRKRTHRSQVRIHAVAACLSNFCCDESSSPWPVLLPLVQGPLDAATARLRPCVAPFLQMVQREGTHRSADTRRGGLLEQWREEVWWFVRARCLLALRAVCRSEWGQGGSGSVWGGGWDGAARGVRRVRGAFSTAGGGAWSQIVQVGGGGRSCAARGSAPRWMETRGGVVRHQRGVSRVSLLVGSGAGAAGRVGFCLGGHGIARSQSRVLCL